MPAQLDEGDIWLSRKSVKLAREQKAIQSLLSPKDDQTTSNDQDESDEGDYETTREVAGLGAVNQNEDFELDALLKLKRTDKDQLLERMIGKKAAEAHRKKQKKDVGKSMSTSNHAAPKPISLTSNKFKTSSRPQESDEEEEGGRAAAFTSRKKTKPAKVLADAVVGEGADASVELDTEPPDPSEEMSTIKEVAKEDEEEDKRPNKRKVGSYLDEVLGQRGKKSKKKKKGKGECG